MKTTLLMFVAAVATQQDPRGRRFQPEPTYSPETPFRDNVPAPVFGAGHNRPSFQQPPRYWGNQEEPQRFQSPWDQSQQQQQRPFGNFEPGAGRDYAEEDGRGPEASGGRDLERPSKVVGVNMQMVAGMYPDGRFSPLSGPYENQRGGEDRSRTRGPPFRQGPFRGDSEAGSHSPRGFFGQKPTSRENVHYEPEERRQEFEGREDRRPEEPRHQKYKSDEEVDEGFRDPNKGGRLHMGRKRPDDEREVGEQPEDVGRFRNFHKEDDRFRHEDPRQHQDRSKGRDPHDRSESRDRDEPKPREEPKPLKPTNLVDGNAGIHPKTEDDKRTTLPEEPLSEPTSPLPLSNTTPVSE